MKLTIELVPKTCWFSNVRSEVTKTKWDTLRKETYKQADHVCEICGGKGHSWPVECHEIWNYDDENKIQKLEGLVSLCPDCHQVKHIGLAQIKGNYKKARNHLAKVNELTELEADRYIAESFDIWAKRSKDEWNLDITWLNNK